MRQVKLFGTFVNTALVLLSISVIAVFPVYGQDADNIGTFDIDRVYEEMEAGSDTVLAGDAASIAGFTRQPENYAIVLLRMTGYLVVITLLIIGAAWAIRKVGVAGVSKVGGGNNMDTIETLYLGQNKGMALVRVGGSVYLVGHTAENIVLMEKIEGDKAIEFIASSKGGSTIVNFKDAFNNFMGKMKR
jgi:flagellar biogenesis protein FliO